MTRYLFTVQAKINGETVISNVCCSVSGNYPTWEEINNVCQSVVLNHLEGESISSSKYHAVVTFFHRINEE